MNVIVIPTELFTQTLLNGYVEHGTLDETVLYHENNTIFEFTGPDRDGTSDKANADVDFVFIRHRISPEDALEVLDLVLNGVINETLDEYNNTIAINATIHNYVSTKLNGTKATQMSLPYSVLGYIPWVNNFTNSVMGDEPDPEGAFDFLLWLLCLVNPILKVVLNTQMAMTGGTFYAYLKEFLASIFMEALAFIAELLWVIARTALIVLFYVLLAVEIATTIPIFAILGVTFSIFGFFAGVHVDWGIELAVTYGIDSRIGYLDYDMSENDKNVKFESWIRWNYWDFFDIYIPYSDMNFNTDINEYLDDIPEDPLIKEESCTRLSCGFIQLDEYIFDFDTIYWDNPQNAPPQYVNLTLLSPAGNHYNYSMEISSTGYKSIEYWEGRTDAMTGDIYSFDEVKQTFIPPNWYRGIRFNKTIDFEDSFDCNERAGQWYYQFRARANRSNSYEAVWPTESEYALGPYFNESGCISQESHKTYLQYQELSPNIGRANEIFNFSVWWADYEEKILPNNVDLMLELPNKSITLYQMTNVSSYTVDYSIVSDYGNVSFVEYKCSLNLSIYINNQSETFRYYYKAYLPNGNYTTLFDLKYVDEDGLPLEDPDDLNATEVKVWFEGPTVYPITNGKPTIKDWRVQDLTSGIDINSFGWLNPIWEEHEIVFWVYCYDSDRSFEYNEKPTCYNQGYPKLDLINKKTNETLSFNNFTWCGYDYDLDADIYWVKVYAGDLGAGAWNFELTLKDSTNQTDIRYKTDLPTLWIVGSAVELYNTLRNAIYIYGYAPAVTFSLFAGIFLSSENIGKVATSLASIVAAISYLGTLMAFINDFVENENSGALYGLGWALITIFLSYTIGDLVARFVSDTSLFEGTKLGGLNILQIFDVIGGLFMAFASFASNVENANVISNLLFIFGDCIQLATLSIVMGILVNKAEFMPLKTTKAMNIMVKVVEIYTVAIGLLSLWSFIMASNVNGFFYLN